MALGAAVGSVTTLWNMPVRSSLRAVAVEHLAIQFAGQDKAYVLPQHRFKVLLADGGYVLSR